MSTIMLAAAVWVTNVRSSISDRLTSERGQGLMEYGILLGGIAVLSAIVLTAFGTISFTGFAASITDCLDFGSGSCP